MPNSNYRVTFKLAGGARVTQTVSASHEGAAAIKVVKKFNATEVLQIRKVKE
jgi:chemotaxis receptor (MCP) glutamine deamidase CheD